MNEYIESIENSGKIYWNKGIVPTKENWGFTNTKCGSNCTSNHFPEMGMGIQCYAFARFIAYLLTGISLYGVDAVQNGANVGGGWTKISDLTNYEFKPGDIVETTDPHTAIVLSSNGTTVQFLELWTREEYGCKLAYGNFYNGITSRAHVDHLRKTVNQGGTVKHVIKCPPIEQVFVEPPELPPDGTTSTIDLYRNHTSTDTALYKNDLEYTAGSGDVINGGVAPTRTGYRFLGWYTARTGGTKVTKYSDIPEGTAALYAQWCEL